MEYIKNLSPEILNAMTYNEHAIFMSRLAIDLLKGNFNILNKKGIKELIAMYLLIPYITNQQLDKPSEKYYNVPKLDVSSLFTKVYNKDNTLSEMTIGRIRDAICHSFVSRLENGDLLLDDRASCDRKTHDNLDDKGFCNRLEIARTSKKLLSLHEKVIKQQKEFVEKFLSMI